MSETNNPTDGGNNGSDNDTIIAIVGACAAVFLLIMVTAIIALAYYVCKKKRELDDMESKLGNLNDVDRVMWAEMGRKDDAVTENPAYGKEDPEDFAPLDVTAIEKEFDDEYESDSEGEKVDGEVEQPKSSRLSILDTKTWAGMPGQKRKKKPRKQIARTISRLENDPEMRKEVEKRFEDKYTEGGHFDYTLFNLNAGPNQRAVNMYEDGHLDLKENDEESLPPKHIPSAGNRLLWQKKRFKDM